jgi:ubiquinone/menaquinone biosynthesis C-methylase UbiE
MNKLLDFPATYNLFSRLIGNYARKIYVEKYIRPNEGDKIFDIGCGTADILFHLPTVDYVGIDANPKYIKHAKRRFGKNGKFMVKSLSEKLMREFSSSDFDKVLAEGILHHLNDDEAIQLFELARYTLKSGGRLITFDGCYIEGQSWMAHFILSMDRGKYVRTKDAYFRLASKVFENIQVNIHNDLLRIPYTHIIMECTT